MTKELQKEKENGEVKNERDTRQTVRTLAPAADIQELADVYVVRLDIPGSDKESIAARVNGATLTVSADVPSPFKQDAVLMYDDAMPTEYRREFSLAENIDTSSIEAEYELGVLKITLRKKQQFLPKQIMIQ